VQAGTNNVGTQSGDDAKVAEITRGIRAILDVCRRKAPARPWLLTGIFPRNDSKAVMPRSIASTRTWRIRRWKQVRCLNINRKLADERGGLFPA